MSEEQSPDEEPEIPEWDDEYLDRVADRLKFNYDLRRDERVRGESFPLYGQLLVESRKQFLHPSVNYATQNAQEHLFARRVDAPAVAELERLVELGNELGEAWVDPDEEHRSTDFTFVVVAEELPEDVAGFVEGFRDRTLLKYGYYGHYEVNLAVVAPDRERYAASENADAWRAFVDWETAEEEPGLLGRLLGTLRG